jgi:enterobactin synthetase component D
VARRQAEFLAGRYCAGRALTEAGLSGVDIPIGEHRAPLWPSGWRGAITHTHADALAVVSQSVDGIGIDLELIPDADVARESAAVVVSPAELALGRTLGLDLPLFFAISFSLKESIFKAFYPHVGHYFGFEAVEVLGIDLDTGAWRARVTMPLAPRFPAGFAVEGRVLVEPASVLTGVVLTAALRSSVDV